MQKVLLPPTYNLTKYRHLISTNTYNQLEVLAKRFHGKKIIEINSTSYGGGVAELLHSQIPFMRELGIDIDWYVIPPNDQFFATTKQLHNCLQGMCPLEPHVDTEFFTNYSDAMAKQLPDADIYILHDPQTIGLARHLKGRKVIWRCHIDLTSAEQATHEWLQSYYQYFSKVIFSLEAYIHGLPRQKAAIVYPSIDPFSTKNIVLTSQQCKTLVAKHGVDVDRPYILQVSRFDKFKDPLGVLHIFSELKKQLPAMQCVLMGNYATDDPEGLEYYKVIKKLAKQIDAKNIHIIVQSDDTTINAFQHQAAAVVQNSAKEGFGLTVTEALWKQKIVFSRPVGGIALQIINNKTGYYLANNDIVSAQKIVDVLSRPAKAQYTVTQAGHKRVKQHFITPIMVRNYLSVYSSTLTSN